MKRILRHRILFSMLIPVLLCGVIATAAVVQIQEPRIRSFILHRVDSVLRLASALAFETCEDGLRNLLDLRLENDPDVVAAMRKETVQQVVELSARFHKIYFLIIDDAGRIVASSSPGRIEGQVLPDIPKRITQVRNAVLGKRPVRLHVRYFPFLRWRLVSFTYARDYQQPIRWLRNGLLLGMGSVTLVMILATLVAFQLRVATPLRHLADATRAVADGRYEPVPVPWEDEMGMVAEAFNTMVRTLHKKDKDIHNALTRLRESEEHYRFLTEYSLAMILMVRDGRIIFANNRARELTGLAPDRLLGLPFEETIVSEDREMVGLMLRATEPSTFRFRYHTASGDPGHMEILAAPIQFRGNLTLLLHGIDITDRMKAEEEKRRLQEKLYQAEKMETLGMLAGAVAHDLNNILTGLVGYPELMLMKLPQDSPLIEPLRTIQNSGVKAAAIVQDLLTLTRRGVQNREVVDINEIVTDYLSSPEFQSLAASNPNVEVIAKLEPDSLPVEGSPRHLRTTVLTLASTAAEAMPRGGTLTLSTEYRYVERPMPAANDETLPEGDYVVISVSDTGCGISPEDQKRIFEPFYTKKVMGRSGTGLGMSVVWGAVKDHGGFIIIESRPNRGTRFDIYLPLSRRELQEKGDEDLPLERFAGGERILVVDDIQEQRAIAMNMLSHLGYDVVTVESGEAAVEILKRKDFDLVILDMLMEPGMDGLETYLEIIRHKPNQRAIIASGFSQTDRVRDALRRGCGSYIRKPYRLRTLAMAVRSELDRQDGSSGESLDQVDSTS